MLKGSQFEKQIPDDALGSTPSKKDKTMKSAPLLDE